MFFKVFLGYQDDGCRKIISKNLSKRNLAGKSPAVVWVDPGKLLELRTNEFCAIIVDSNLLADFAGQDVLEQVANNNPFSFRFVLCKPEEEKDFRSRARGLAWVVEKPFTPHKIGSFAKEIERMFEILKERT